MNDSQMRKVDALICALSGDERGIYREIAEYAVSLVFHEGRYKSAV